MFSNMKIVKMGNFVRISSVKLKNSSTIGEAITQKKIYDSKLKCHLIRAKNTITELALSNDFSYFFTLTFNTKYDRFNLSDLRFRFSRIVSNMRQNTDYDLKYLVVPEQHKNGAWHFHRLSYC